MPRPNYRPIHTRESLTCWPFHEIGCLSIGLCIFLGVPFLWAGLSFRSIFPLVCAAFLCVSAIFVYRRMMYTKVVITHHSYIRSNPVTGAETSVEWKDVTHILRRTGSWRGLDNYFVILKNGRRIPLHLLPDTAKRFSRFLPPHLIIEKERKTRH